MKYESETKPALRALERAAHQPAPLAEIKAAVDAAAAAGATPHEIAEAVGGREAWNALVRSLRTAGLLAQKGGQ
jgi:hypothetical protein